MLVTKALLLDASSFAQEEAVRSPSSKLPIQNSDFYETLKAIVNKRQAEYTTTIAEDVVILRNSNLRNRHRMAVEVRLGEKELLAAACEAVDKALEERRAKHEQAKPSFYDAQHAKKRKT